MSKEKLDEENKKDLEDHLNKNSPEEKEPLDPFNESDSNSADDQSNPLQDEGSVTLARELMDDIKRLHAKSILTAKEADVLSKLVDKSEYHTPVGSLGKDKHGKWIVPSLLQYVQNSLKFRMSIGGARVEQVVRPYGDLVKSTKKKTLKDRMLSS